MRASGREAGRARGGIRSPRGPFLRFRACARGPLPRSGGMLRAGPFCVRGAFSCARVSSAVWGIMNGYESAFALTGP